MSTGSKQRPFIRTKGGSLACVHPTRRKSAKAQNKAEAAGHHMAPPRHADSLAPDYGQGRPLRLRAGGRPRLATAPHSRGPARGALRFSGPVLGRRPSALFALVSEAPSKGALETSFLIRLLLFLDVLFHTLQLKSHRGHRIATRPKVLVRQIPLFLLNSPSDGQGALALQEANYRSHCVLGGNLDTHVDMIG